jgi:hypothetical protein
MKIYFKAILLLVFGLAVNLQAQLSPQDAVNGMARGINIGNTMEAPVEGTWGNPPVKERAFDDYKNAGFTAIRIPITWDGHTSKTPPYTVDTAWMSRVEQVVDWGLQRGLFIMINAHHESWLKNTYSDSNAARFDSIWSQIATRFKDKSDSLIFEILNEPYPMTEAHVNELNARVLKIIRRTNPTRIVSFSGYMWSNSDQLVTAAIPDSSDKYLIGYYHSYDPWPFGLEGPGTYGSASDIATTKAKFDQVTAWSRKNNIPVILGEFGFIDKCEYNSRMCAYATDVDQALRHGVPTFVWDDGGDFDIYNRTTGGFNEIKDILIHTYPESPNGLKISQVASTTVKLRWQNRNTEEDSIFIQRRVGSGDFSDYAQVAPTVSQFIDSSTIAGTAYYYRLKITMKDSVELQSYPIMLNVVPVAVFSCSPTAIAFDSVKIGQSESGSLTVKNVGMDTLRLNSVAVKDTSFAIGPYRSTIAPGDSSVLIVTFRPSSTGQHNGYIVFSHNAASSPDSVSVSGTGYETTDVGSGQEAVLHRFRLDQNYPNPFNPSTIISYQLPSSGVVTLRIYDLLGREVKTLVNQREDAGNHSVLFDAADLSSGVYYYRIQAGSYVETKKLVVLR